MFLARTRSMLPRRRGSLLAICAVALLGLVVIAAHSEPSAHQMDGHEAGMTGAMSICLAVLQAGGVMVIAILLGIHRRRVRAPLLIGEVGTSRFIKFTSDPGHRIREGPSVLQVFRN